MNVSGARRRANLSIDGESAESTTAQVVARARILMLVAGLTTALAIAAVVTVIGFRMVGGTVIAAVDDTVVLPVSARVITTAASAGRIAVLIEHEDGSSDLRTFDIKTLKQTGRLRFEGGEP